MFWQVLCVTNTILNLFFGLVLGIVAYSSIKRLKHVKDVKKKLGGK